jgi:hypothetical protein
MKKKKKGGEGNNGLGDEGKGCGAALQHASLERRADKLCVLEAVKRDKAMLKVVSEELRSDKEVRLDKKKKSPSVVVCHFFSVQCAVVISLALFLSLGTKHARARKK